MYDENLFNVPEVIRIYNETRSISTTAGISTTSFIAQTTIPIIIHSDISPLTCIGLTLLILSTVIGNILVLSAIFLDKRLHFPSFFLIANMSTADLLLGISVLPFSSILEILNDRWIFGQGVCSTWLALDVLCCTASIIALMAISIDRYIGVTRPLNYGSIMTTQRTIYLIIIVWAVSILTSVVPLFGLTDRGNKSKDIPIKLENVETCTINKNTFYTIFSSMISFYIPVVILLILYSRVYQEANKQGKKLENEKRRLYEIDYQIASEHIRQQQNHSNGHSIKHRTPSNQSDDDNNKNDTSSTPLNQENNPDEEYNLDRGLTTIDEVQLEKDILHHKNKKDDDNSSHSDTSIVPKKSRTRRLLGKRLFSTINRNSLHNISHPFQYNNQTSANDELAIIKRKLHNLKREKKAFRTVGLILGALLICWLPFFVTLPVISILKHHGLIQDENTENTWFKITFWLGYCNSALNPFVYAFSNRAIRRAFRQIIFRRCCCCCFCCRKKTNNEQPNNRRQRLLSGSLTTDSSQIFHRKTNSVNKDVALVISKTENNPNTSSDAILQPADATTREPVVSFTDFLAATGDDDNDDDDDDNDILSESISTSAKQTSNLT